MSDPKAAETRLASEAPAGLFEITPDGRLVAVNAVVEDLIGVAPDAIVGSRLRDHLTPASQVIYALKVELRLFETGHVQEVFLEFAHADGHPRPALMTTRPAPASAGAMSTRYGVLFPAPERRAHERELIAARAAAESAAETRARFLAIVSHELRTPLNGVLGVTSLLEASPNLAFSRDFADIIAKSARRLETIVDDILDFASLDAAHATFEPEPVNVADLVDGACEQLRPVAEERGLTLSYVADAAAQGVFLADPRRLRQILRPLLNNAIKFTRTGGVAVALGIKDGRLQLAVRDTGIGLDPDDLERLSAPFEQGDTSITRRFEGAGLGLAIAKSLVEQMDGRLEVQSAPGQGSCFTVQWPAVRAAPATPEAAVRPSTPPPQSPSGDQAPLRILYAEDDVMNQMLIEAMANHLGYEVTLVEDGAAALAQIEAQAFDLVLMDMQMPVMDGLAATRELRRREAAAGAPRLPVIMLTANSMPDDIAASLAAGVDRHLSKPITAGYLSRAIVETLGRAAGPARAWL